MVASVVSTLTSSLCSLSLESLTPSVSSFSRSLSATNSSELYFLFSLPFEALVSFVWAFFVSPVSDFPAAFTFFVSVVTLAVAGFALGLAFGSVSTGALA